MQNDIYKSGKEIKDIQHYITKKTYIFTKEKAQGYGIVRNPENNEPSIQLAINFKSYYLALDKPVVVPQELWSLLVDIKLIRNTGGFDPIRGNG